MAKVLHREMVFQQQKKQRIKDEKVEILGIPFNNTTKHQMTDRIRTFVQTPVKDNLFIVTANPEIAYYAKTNEKYMNRIKTADYIIADGIGIVKAAKHLDYEIKERIPGIELMEEMLNIANEGHKRVFLLGASKETVKKCKQQLRDQYPNITFKSKHGYKEIHDYKTLKKVKNFKPDFIFVAMGYPKQESWIYFNQHHFQHTVMMGVGGSFDVFSGNVKRAPQLFINMNLEWFYRMITDIKRIKRMIMIPLFLYEVMKQKYTPEYNPHAHFKDKD